MNFDYDVIVIGGGAAGFTVSKTLAGMGKKTAIIEKKQLGGECTWYGCIPSKSLIKISEKFYSLKFLEKNGFEISPQKIDTSKVMDYVHKKVEQVYNGHKPEAFIKSGIDVYFGAPEFVDNHKIKLNDKELSSKFFVLSTGSSAFIPPIPGLNNIDWLDNEKFFKLDKLPESMIVLGGGPIGIELSQALNRLAVKTTVIEMMDRIMFREDKELSLMLQQKLINEGLNIITSAKAINVEEKNEKVIVTYERDGKKLQVSADKILVAVGRKPNLEGLQLEKAGVKYTNKNVEVDETLKTTAPNIYACGDIVGPYQFSHVSEYHGVTAGINIVSPFKKKVDYSNVLWATFTEPEFARTGITESEAREKFGDNIKIFKYNFSDIDRGKTDSTEFGMAKFILHSNGKLLGAHILGERAGDLIHEAQILKSFNIPFYKLQKVMHAYPSYADISRQTAKKVYIDKIQNNFFVKIIKKVMGK